MLKLPKRPSSSGSKLHCDIRCPKKKKKRFLSRLDGLLKPGCNCVQEVEPGSP